MKPRTQRTPRKHLLRLWEPFRVVWILYLGFFGALGTYLYQRHLYRDVEHWPSVPAIHVENGSSGRSMPFTGRDGRPAGMPSSSWTKFDYEVDGRLFRKEASFIGSSDQYRISRELSRTPAAGSAHSSTADMALNPDSPPRAYYHPDHPEIAVLNPVPYRSELLGIAIVVSGLLVALHLFFTLRQEF